jgi:hypothetical protein
MTFISLNQVLEITDRSVKSHSCSDYGRMPYQVMGIYFDPDLSKFFSAVDIIGVGPVYFEIEGCNLKSDEKICGKKIDYFFSGPYAKYTTWINPNYNPSSTPDPLIEITCFEQKIKDGLVFEAKGSVTMPDCLKYDGKLKIKFNVR